MRISDWSSDVCSSDLVAEGCRLARRAVRLAMNITGLTAIVSGASTGIGREVARELASRSASVVLASLNREKLEALAEELAPYPGPTLVIPTDVTDRYAVEALARRTVEVFGSIDVLVNNAG